VHGDIKPANLFLSSPMHVKVGDFGMACRAGVRKGTSGTPNYMAPELLVGKSVGNRDPPPPPPPPLPCPGGLRRRGGALVTGSAYRMHGSGTTGMSVGPLVARVRRVRTPVRPAAVSGAGARPRIGRVPAVGPVRSRTRAALRTECEVPSRTAARTGATARLCVRVRVCACVGCGMSACVCVRARPAGSRRSERGHTRRRPALDLREASRYPLEAHPRLRRSSRDSSR
jgi:hypothetical protein